MNFVPALVMCLLMQVTPPIVQKASVPPVRVKTVNTGQRSDDAERPLTVSKLPPVTIIPAKRDWVDWGYWAFTGLLALTGILQIWVLWRTLKITTRQAEIARNQETQMKQAGEQTERIIAQMKETTQKELRAYVGVSKIFLSLTDPTLPVGSVEIRNFGQTPAYKVRQWVGIAPNTFPLSGPLPENPFPQGSSSVLPPGIPLTGTVPLKMSLPVGTPFGGPHGITMYVYGGIIYEDIFGQERHTVYRYFYGGPNREDTLSGIMSSDTSGNEAD